ncbi:MAG: hypothetical protein HUJ24_03665 [Rhodobacteraceae bacterium]|nr:hypothetical protein [Paracoccaceae bacterium]
MRTALIFAALAVLAVGVETESHVVDVDPINIDVNTGEYRPLPGIPNQKRHP